MEVIIGKFYEAKNKYVGKQRDSVVRDEKEVKKSDKKIL